MATVYDKTKKKRAINRTATTKLLNELKNENLPREEVIVKIEILRKFELTLHTLDEQIMDMMLDESDNEEGCIREAENARVYMEDIERVRNRALGRHKNVREEQDDGDDDERSTVSTTETQGRKKNDVHASFSSYKLPKVSFEKYDLSPTNWASFWGQFERIHEDTTLSNTEKFQYLRMSLLGRSKIIVENFTFNEDNYVNAIEKLKEKYGRKELIINHVYKDLLSLVRSQPNLSDLNDIVGSKISCLKSYGIKNEQVIMLLPLIVDCLPRESRRLWERRQGSETEDKMDELIKFIGNEAEAEERMTSSSSNALKTKREISTAAVFVSTPREKKPNNCIFCGASHANKDCTKKMPVMERRELVKKNRCCFACLAPGHNIGQCKTRERLSCANCKGKHRELCCVKTEKTAVEEMKKDASQPDADTPTASCFAGAAKGTTIMLQTLLATSNNRKVRVLLDTGSHRSYASPQICNESGTAIGEEVFSHMLFGGSTSGQVQHTVYSITLSSIDGKNSVTFNALEQDTICGSVPNFHTREIVQKFIDEEIPLCYDDQERPIEVLLGADTIPKIVKGVRSVDKMLAFETTLGWCAMGTYENGNSQNSLLSLLTVPHLPSLWEFEPLGIEKSVKSHNVDVDCIQEFNKTVKIDQDGKYHVCLPWVEGHPPIADHRQMAEIRLNQVVQRLKRNNLYDEYDNVFHEWEKEGIIENVPEDAEVNASHYLPHRPVIREGKTTKIRPVFDASAKGPGEVSINDCLYAGPNLTADLMKLLLKFRCESIGVTADIRKAFLMINLSLDADKNMLKFLWYRHSKIQTFRHCKVVFGLTCSPFLLNATLAHLLKDRDDVVSTQLKDSFYVDDVVTSVGTREKAEEFIKAATALLAQGGFDLRGWVTSGNDAEQVVLGIRWLPSVDTIGIRKPEVSSSSNFTKKEILSLVGRIYDPLGLLASAALPLKLLLKECFKLKLSWDEPVPKEIQVPVTKWLAEIDLIDAILIPRCIKSNNVGDAQLHVFSDASMHAMGACVFLRWQEDDKVLTTLVSSKARVSPTESITIPRLELVAALLAARLANTVITALQVIETTFWTDSTIVLYWIKKGEWKTFVGNRVKEIRQLTDPEQWRFVPGEMNPADIVSRGCLLSEYLKIKWWEGPSWLKESPETWPIDKVISTTLEAQTVTLVNVTDEKDQDLFVGISKFSRVVRVVGWIQRFITNAKGKASERKGKETLTFEEVRIAEETLLLWIQSAFTLNLKDMTVFRDTKGLLRVRTKLLADTFEVSFKEPIFLPICPFVEALVEEYHRKLHHAGATTVLGALREKYWIPTGRRVTRKVISRCIRCRLHQAKPSTTPAVGLPLNRVQMGKAFEVCGCDLAGPLFLKSQEKIWIVLFTCAVYRAVHLEIVNSLSTEAFIMAFRRMIARRGQVKEMYSDNGTNFVGAWNSIKAVEVETALNLKWIFNVPHAPWWGGFFERLIRVMKNMLRRTLGRALLNETELSTIVTEVEGLINSRPITYCSDDVNELEPLTPLNFIQENFNVSTTQLDAVDAKSFTKRIRYVQEIRGQLKERFRKEYLGALLLGSSRASDPMKEGELVWVIADDEKRVNWKLGRVVECISGKDNMVRAVRVKTDTSVILRPVQKLVRMEVGGEFTVVSNDMTSHSSDNSDNEPCEEIIVPIHQKLTRSKRVIKRPERLDL